MCSSYRYQEGFFIIAKGLEKKQQVGALVENKKVIIVISSLLLSMPIYAGFKEFTMHSRANCGGFNESISWHFNHSYNLLTYSLHTNPKVKYSCRFNSGGWDTTWRSAACHFAEGYGGWHVDGYHYTRDDRGNERLLKVTSVDDCAIYDGWWDV